ncbi:MAG: tagaturonate epimerase family protein, partial [Phycisphaeraceae bacterium]
MTTKQTPVTLGIAASFGFGDRIGLATPGHVLAMKEAGEGILPMYPQQSIREMARTVREPIAVMNDAMDAAIASGWDGPIGADADHLKTPEDVDRTAAVGFPFFTIDPSDDVDEKSDSYDEATLRTKFADIRGDVAWYDGYLGKDITLPNGTVIKLDEEACMRCAVKYGKAINSALKLADYIKEVHEKAGKDYEIELSVDETDQPTTLAEHYII